MAVLKKLYDANRFHAAPAAAAVEPLDPTMAQRTREEHTTHDPETGEVTENYLVDALVGEDDVVTHEIDEAIVDAWLDATQALIRALYNDKLFGYIEQKDGTRVQRDVSDAHFFVDGVISGCVRQAEFVERALEKNGTFIGEVQSRAAGGQEIDMDKLASLVRFRVASEARQDFWAGMSHDLKSMRITELGMPYVDYRNRAKPLSKQAGTELAAELGKMLARKSRHA